MVRLLVVLASAMCASAFSDYQLVEKLDVDTSSNKHGFCNPTNLNGGPTICGFNILGQKSRCYFMHLSSVASDGKWAQELERNCVNLGPTLNSPAPDCSSANLPLQRQRWGLDLLVAHVNCPGHELLLGRQLRNNDSTFLRHTLQLSVNMPKPSSIASLSREDAEDMRQLGHTLFVDGFQLVHVGEVSGSSDRRQYLFARRPVPFIDKRRVVGKTVWLLWFQGWESAPWLIREDAKSWRRHNPSWNIEFLSWENLHEYLHIPYIHTKRMSLQAKSDVIRLHLLSEYGGIWADASIVCFGSLDDWIYDALRPSGYWAYEFRHRPASWFLVSVRQSVIAQKWRHAADNFWRNRLSHHDCLEDNCAVNYNWMDDQMDWGLMLHDKEVKEAWARTPQMSVGLPDAANIIWNSQGRMSLRIFNILKDNPPWLAKGSLHGFGDPRVNDTRPGYWALNFSHLTRPLRHEYESRTPPDKWPTHGWQVIEPECDGPFNLSLHGDHKARGRKVVILDKCTFCTNYSLDTACFPSKGSTARRENPVISKWPSWLHEPTPGGGITPSMYPAWLPLSPPSPPSPPFPPPPKN